MKHEIVLKVDGSLPDFFVILIRNGYRVKATPIDIDGKEYVFVTWE